MRDTGSGIVSQYLHLVPRIPYHVTHNTPTMQDNEEPVVLADLNSEAEAVMIVAALAEEGIEAFKSGGPVADFKVGIPGHVQVLVRPEDVNRARAAFAHLKDEEGDIDWSQVDVGRSEEE
jgi:hypothetical protein